MEGRHVLRNLLIGLVGGLAGIGAGLLAIGSGLEVWLSLVIGLVAGGVATAALGVGAWVLWPYPVDADAMLGSPDDVYWHSPGWRRFAGWIARHGASRTAR